MIVTDVSSRFEHGVHSIRAAFEQPRLLFCSASGRIWPATGMSSGANRAPLGPS